MKKILLFLVLFSNVAFSQITIIRPTKTVGAVNLTNNLSDIGWQRSGSKVYLFNATDPVGIGTSTPSGIFEVLSSVTNKPDVYFTNTNADATSMRLYLVKNSSSPAVNDLIGQIFFRANYTPTPALVNYITLEGTTANPVSGAEAGQLDIKMLSNGSEKTFLSMYGSVSSDQRIVINESGADSDFRIETSSEPNAFFLQGSDGYLGLGTNSLSAHLHIKEANTGTPKIMLESTHSGFFGSEIIHFKNVQAAELSDIGWSQYKALNSAGSALDFARLTILTEDTLAGQEAGRVDWEVSVNSSLRTLLMLRGDTGTAGQGEVSINEDSEDIDFRVESNGDANAFFVQGSDGYIGVGTNSPTTNVHVSSSVSFEPVLGIENTNVDASGSYLQFFKNSATPAADDVLGTVSFLGNDDGTPTIETFSSIVSKADKVTNGSEHGSLELKNIMNGTDRSFLKLDAYNGSDNQGEIIFNESGQDIDTRMESSGSTNAFFLEGSTGEIGIGTSTPAYNVEVESSVSNDPYVNLKNTNADALSAILGFEKSTASPLAGDQVGQLVWTYEQDNYATVTVSADDITLGDLAGTYEVKVRVNDILRSVIKVEGNKSGVGQAEIRLNDDGQDVDFNIEDSGSTVAFSVEGSSGNIGVGGSTPGEAVDLLVRGTTAARAVRLRSGALGASSSASTSAVDMYYKGSILIFRYDDGGTVRYKYLDMSGTGTTWTHSTVEP